MLENISCVIKTFNMTFTVKFSRKSFILIHPSSFNFRNFFIVNKIPLRVNMLSCNLKAYVVK